MYTSVALFLVDIEVTENNAFLFVSGVCVVFASSDNGLKQHFLRVAGLYVVL